MHAGLTLCVEVRVAMRVRLLMHAGPTLVVGARGGTGRALRLPCVHAGLTLMHACTRGTWPGGCLMDACVDARASHPCAWGRVRVACVDAHS